MIECKCTMSQRLVGDGCEVCNPTLALEYAKETIAELQAELTEAKKDAMCWHMTRQWHSVETIVRIEQSASEAMKGK